MIHIVAFHTAFVLCGWYILTAGGRPERAAFLAQAAALLLTDFTGFVTISGAFSALVLGWATADVLLLIALTAIAFRSNRLWPILLSGLQLSGTLVHATKVIYPDLPATGYAIFVQMWAWPMLLVTVIGTKHHQTRLRLYGPEEDWKAAGASIARV